MGFQTNTEAQLSQFYDVIIIYKFENLIVIDFISRAKFMRVSIFCLTSLDFAGTITSKVCFFMGKEAYCKSRCAGSCADVPLWQFSLA